MTATLPDTNPGGHGYRECCCKCDDYGMFHLLKIEENIWKIYCVNCMHAQGTVKCNCDECIPQITFKLHGDYFDDREQD